MFLFSFVFVLLSAGSLPLGRLCGLDVEEVPDPDGLVLGRYDDLVFVQKAESGVCDEASLTLDVLVIPPGLFGEALLWVGFLPVLEAFVEF